LLDDPARIAARITSLSNLRLFHHLVRGDGLHRDGDAGRRALRSDLFHGRSRRVLGVEEEYRQPFVAVQCGLRVEAYRTTRGM
jgi:hypothetical protein